MQIVFQFNFFYCNYIMSITIEKIDKDVIEEIIASNLFNFHYELDSELKIEKIYLKINKKINEDLLSHIKFVAPTDFKKLYIKAIKKNDVIIYEDPKDASSSLDYNFIKDKYDFTSNIFDLKIINKDDKSSSFNVFLDKKNKIEFELAGEEQEQEEEGEEQKEEEASKKSTNELLLINLKNYNFKKIIFPFSTNSTNDLKDINLLENKKITQKTLFHPIDEIDFGKIDKKKIIEYAVNETVKTLIITIVKEVVKKLNINGNNPLNNKEIKLENISLNDDITSEIGNIKITQPKKKKNKRRIN